jgi:hypothetical protein
MYHHLAKKRALEEALWLAKKEFIKQGFSFPGAWAGVVVVH